MYQYATMGSGEASQTEIHHGSRENNKTNQETIVRNEKTKTTFTPILELHNRFDIEPDTGEGGFSQQEMTDTTP